MANPPNIPFSQLNPAQVQGLGPFPTKNQLLFPQPGAVMILPANQGNGTAGYIRTLQMQMNSTKIFTIAMWVYCPRSTFQNYGLIQSIFEFGIPIGAEEVVEQYYINIKNDAFDENAFGGTVEVSSDPNSVLPPGTPEFVWFDGIYFQYKVLKTNNPYNKVCSLVAVCSDNFATGEFYGLFHDDNGNVVEQFDALNSSEAGSIQFITDNWAFVALSVLSPKANFPYANQEFSLPCLSVNLNSTSQPQGPIAYAQVQMWSTFGLIFKDRTVNENFVVTDLNTGLRHPANPYTALQLDPDFQNTVRFLPSQDSLYYYPPAQDAYGRSDIILDGYATEIIPISKLTRPLFMDNTGKAGPFEYNNVVAFFPGP